MKKNAIVALGILTLSLLVLPTVFADGDDNVAMLIDVFVASEEPGGVSGNLEYIRDQLIKTPFRFNSYRSLATQMMNIPIGGKETAVFSIGWELSLELKVLVVSEESVSFSVIMHRDGELIMESSLSLARQGTVLVGGPRLDTGAIMIAITERW